MMMIQSYELNASPHSVAFSFRQRFRFNWATRRRSSCRKVKPDAAALKLAHVFFKSKLKKVRSFRKTTKLFNNLKGESVILCHFKKQKLRRKSFLKSHSQLFISKRRKSPPSGQRRTVEISFMSNVTIFIVLNGKTDVK